MILPDQPEFRGTLDMQVDREALGKVIQRLRDEHHLPLAVAQGLDVEKVPLTLRLRQVSVEAALAAIAAALGGGYRWRPKGATAELDRPEAARWPAAIAPEAADQVRSVLLARGLLPSSDSPGATSPVYRQSIAAGYLRGLQDVAAGLWLFDS